MGQTALFALAGPVVRQIGLTEIQWGWIVSCAAVVFMLVSPLWGRWADRFGRKRMLMLGVVGFSVANLAFTRVLDFGLSSEWPVMVVFWAMLGLRMAFAFWGAAVQPAAAGVLIDASSSTERSGVLALLGAAMGLGMALGPALTAALTGFSLTLPLYLTSLLGLAAALAIGLTLPTAPVVTYRPPTQKVPGPLRRVLAGGLLFFIAVASLQQTLGFFVQDRLALDTVTAARVAGLGFMTLAAATLVVQGFWVAKLGWSGRPLMTAGLPVLLAGVVIYLSAAHSAQVYFAAVVMGVGFGFANAGVLTWASERADREHQGQAAGLVQSTMAAGYVVGPLAASTLYAFSPFAMGAWVVSCLAVSFVVVVSAPALVTQYEQ